MKCLRPITFLAAVILLSASSAHATGSHGNTTPPSPPAHTSADSSAVSGALSLSKSASSSKSNSQSASVSNATGGQSTSSAVGLGGNSSAAGGNSNQSQTAIGGAAAAGDSSASASIQAQTGDNAVNIEGDTYNAPRIPVATAIAGGTNTTAACRYSVGAGGQATVLGLSFGLGRKDRDCERLVLAQYLYDRGQDFAGDRLMCQITAMKEALGDDCLAMIHETHIVRVDPRILKREAFERGVGK